MCEYIYQKIEVGNRIRERRKALCLTQEQLAEKIDKSWRFMVDLERGKVGMSIETLFRLCSALKTTPNDLLLFDGMEHDSELDWAMGALSNAPEHVRVSAIEILRAYLRSV